MIAFIMPKQRPEYLQHEKTRHGKLVWYYRPPDGKRTRILGLYGSPEFMASLEAARFGTATGTTSTAKPYTIAWCIEKLMASPQWTNLAGASRKQMTIQFAKLDPSGTASLISQVRRKDILAGRDRRSGIPSDANKYVRAMKMVCAFAVEQDWLETNPVVNIPKLRTSSTGEGFYTWQAHDFAAFENRWAIGTMERLAYEIYCGTVLRRGDVHKFGRQHMKDGTFSVRTSKTGMQVESDIPRRLARAIDATKCGEMTLLVTTRGTPFKSKESFGNWFGDACKAAGVPGSGHGIRKGMAALAAENDVTEAQMNALWGWAHGSRESATYIAKASRAKMAKTVTRTLKKVRG